MIYLSFLSIFFRILSIAIVCSALAFPYFLWKILPNLKKKFSSKEALAHHNDGTVLIIAIHCLVIISMAIYFILLLFSPGMLFAIGLFIMSLPFLAYFAGSLILWAIYYLLSYKNRFLKASLILLPICISATFMLSYPAYFYPWMLALDLISGGAKYYQTNLPMPAHLLENSMGGSIQPIVRSFENHNIQAIYYSYDPKEVISYFYSTDLVDEKCRGFYENIMSDHRGRNKRPKEIYLKLLGCIAREKRSLPESYLKYSNNTQTEKSWKTLYQPVCWKIERIELVQKGKENSTIWLYKKFCNGSNKERFDIPLANIVVFNNKQNNVKMLAPLNNTVVDETEKNIALKKLLGSPTGETIEFTPDFVKDKLKQMDLIRQEDLSYY